MNIVMIEPVEMTKKPIENGDLASCAKKRRTIDHNKVASRQLHFNKRNKKKIIDQVMLEMIIEDLRKQLNNLARQKDLSDNLVIQLSQELDLYIVQYQKLTQRE